MTPALTLLPPSLTEGGGLVLRLERDGKTFQGSLADLAAALRAGELIPGEVPLLALTQAVLNQLQSGPGWIQGEVSGPPAELLPPLAAVIALKTRLLLPTPQSNDPAPEDDLQADWDEMTSGLEALAELEQAVQFLSGRRAARQGLIPAPVPRPGLDLPRQQRPRRQGQNLSRLLEAARAAVREVDVPLLARERLSLRGALNALVAFGKRLRHFTFGGITAQDWGERTTYFAALLEGLKTGDLQAEQSEPFGEIRIELITPAEAPQG